MKMHTSKYKEHIEQENLIKWFRIQHPEYKDLFIHVPNGQNVGVRQGARLKGMGLCAGFPDLFLFVPRGGYNGLAIEMKAPKGRPTQRQLTVINQLTEQNYQAHVCFGFDDAVEKIKEYLHG